MLLQSSAHRSPEPEPGLLYNNTTTTVAEVKHPTPSASAEYTQQQPQSQHPTLISHVRKRPAMTSSQPSSSSSSSSSHLQSSSSPHTVSTAAGVVSPTSALPTTLRHSGSDDFSPGAVYLPRSTSSDAIVPGAPSPLSSSPISSALATELDNIGSISNSSSSTTGSSSSNTSSSSSSTTWVIPQQNYSHHLQHMHHPHPHPSPPGLHTIQEKRHSNTEKTPAQRHSLEEMDRQQELLNTEQKASSALSTPASLSSSPAPSSASSATLQTSPFFVLSPSPPLPISVSPNGVHRPVASSRKEGEREGEGKEEARQTEATATPQTQRQQQAQPIQQSTSSQIRPHSHHPQHHHHHPLTSPLSNGTNGHTPSPIGDSGPHHPMTAPLSAASSSTAAAATSAVSANHHHHPPPPPPPLHPHSSGHSAHHPHSNHPHPHHPDALSDLHKVRAAVEESPDAKWARYAVKLGSGTFKDVWLGIDTETGKEVAWNVVDFRRVALKDQQRIRQETQLLTQLRHPHIIEMYDVWDNPHKQEFCFITQKSSYTLKQQIANLHPAKIKVIKKYCRQILSALVYLHGLTPPIIHRDIKCDNIFIDGTTGDIRIGDFGLSISATNPTSIVGTPGYISPEMFGESYNELVDIWSFGMCVLEMATNQYPYAEYNGSVAQLLKKGYEGAQPEALTNLSDAGLREFISMCLQPVARRPSAKQLLEQKVFDLTETVKQPTTAATTAANTTTTAAAAAASALPPSLPSPVSLITAISSSPAPVAIPLGQKSEDVVKTGVGRRESLNNPSSASLPISALGPRDEVPLVALIKSPTPVVPVVPIIPASPLALVVSNLSPVLASQPQRTVTPPLLPLQVSPRAASQSVPQASSNLSTPISLTVGTLPPAPSSISSISSSSSSLSSTFSSSPNLSSHSLSSQHSHSDDSKREAFRRRAESLIPKVEVSKTDKPSVVSIILYVRFPSARELRKARKEKMLLQRQQGNGVDDGDHIDSPTLILEEESQQQLQQQSNCIEEKTIQQQHQQQPMMKESAVGRGDIRDITDQVILTGLPTPSSTTSTASSMTPPSSRPASPVNSQEFTPIRIPSYDFSRDNYLAVATDLVHDSAAFQSLELEGVEELVAFRIEEGTRERYNKWAAKARTTLNSEIMTLLTSLGITLNYALSFIEQEVSIDDLLYLSEEDLATFIPKLGPRRRLQQYINDTKEKLRKAAETAQAVEEECLISTINSDEDDNKRKKKHNNGISSSNNSSSSNISGAAGSNPGSAEKKGEVKKERKQDKDKGDRTDRDKSDKKERGAKNKDKDTERSSKDKTGSKSSADKGKKDRERRIDEVDVEADPTKTRDRSLSTPKLKDKERRIATDTTSATSGATSATQHLTTTGNPSSIVSTPTTTHSTSSTSSSGQTTTSPIVSLPASAALSTRSDSGYREKKPDTGS